MSDTDKAELPADDLRPRADRGRPRPAFALFFTMLILAAAGGLAFYLVHEAQDARFTELETRLEGAGANSALDQALRDEIGALQARIAQLEDRVGMLENAAQAPESPAPDPRIGELASRLNMLEDVLPADLAARLNALPSRAEQDSLAARVAALEIENSDEMLRRAANILALTELSHAASGPSPFAIELEAVALIAPADPALRALRQHAAEGVATPAQLAAEFSPLAREALAAERNVPDAGLIARMWNGVLSLISIRRVGNVAGESPEARIARAEAALAEENLELAVAELRPLQGAAADRLAPWLERAEARLRIDEAVAAINSRIVQTLAQGDGTTPAR